MSDTADPVAARLAARLAQLWQSSRPVILERIAVLHATQNALIHDPQDSESRLRGREAAHKLAGVLGTFGLPRGSEVASEIEHLLQSALPLNTDDLAKLHSQIAELEAEVGAN